MAKAVDRLELVADEEQLLGLEQVDELALEPVRVLELVDQHRPEAPARPLPHLRPVPQEIARPQLEILEIECGLDRLGVRVGAIEGAEERFEQLAVAGGDRLERGGLDLLQTPR